jgi:hypothetical protein
MRSSWIWGMGCGSEGQPTQDFDHAPGLGAVLRMESPGGGERGRLWEVKDWKLLLPVVPGLATG